MTKRQSNYKINNAVGKYVSVQTHDSAVSVSEVKDLLKKTVCFDAGQSSGWRPRSNGHNTHVKPIIS